MIRSALPSTTDLYRFAWRHVRRLPDGLVRGAAHLAADGVWLVGTSGVRRLEANLGRLRPDLSPRELRRTTRAGMRSYFRYFVEVFQLPGWSTEVVDARVRAVGTQEAADAVAGGDSVVLALGHAGNWDLAGAWAARHLGPVLTVAEKLPDGLYEEFVGFRNALGIQIVPLEGSGTFRRLLRLTRERAQVVPLLADRDLTANGIEVVIAGQRARVATGPAVLALTAGCALYPVAMHYERLTGERRRAAGSPWGLVLEFLPPIPTRLDGERREVVEVTQDWVTALFARFAAHPQDWHMLQRVFLADLDPARLADVPGGG